MTAPRYIVLRDYGGKLQTVGPMAEAFHEEAHAELHARALSYRHPSQSFAVAQIVMEYGHDVVPIARKVNAPADQTVTPMKARKT